MEDIADLLDDTPAAGIQQLSPAFWLGMAQKDPRFQVGQGGLIGLAEWESVRRHSLASAMRTIVESTTGALSLTEIENLLGKLDVPVPARPTIRNDLRKAGCTSPDGGDTWCFPPRNTAKDGADNDA
jgi:hypothetical protein